MIGKPELVPWLSWRRDKGKRESEFTTGIQSVEGDSGGDRENSGGTSVITYKIHLYIHTYSLHVIAIQRVHMSSSSSSCNCG